MRYVWFSMIYSRLLQTRCMTNGWRMSKAYLEALSKIPSSRCPATEITNVAPALMFESCLCRTGWRGSMAVWPRLPTFGPPAFKNILSIGGSTIGLKIG